ncbi:glycosyl transferase, partial [Escherichia coli]|nr:glycosyl transferase [Escherichia coli]
EYRFWNKNDIETFLKTYYPEFIPAYNAFPHNVQRWDAIRYLILYKFGGLYVDMDYECTENITPILCNTECAMGLEPEAHAVRIHVPYIVGNAFMATVPEHPYFKELIDAVFCTEKNSNMYSDLCELILNTTGPYMTTQVYKNSNYQKRVTLIPAELITPLTHTDIKRIINTETTKNVESKIEKSFAIHYFFGSWHK